jgi:pyruvate ferredoxin oxidoreductase gamma subunit
MFAPDRPLGLRLHGRGGQGVVTAAELLSVAAFLDGRYAQAFPSFGSERMGAPVMSFCRVANRPIRTREPVSRPEVIVVVDATLLHHVDLFAGLAPDGCLVINSSRAPQELGLASVLSAAPARRLVTVPATDLARTHIGRPLPNVCLLGAVAAATGVVSLASLEHAVRERFPESVAAANIAAARAAFALVTEPAHA